MHHPFYGKHAGRTEQMGTIQLFSGLILLFMIQLCGCYSVQTVPVEEISQVEDQKILSYVTEEGKEITALNEGNRFEESTLVNDTLTIKYSAKSEGYKGWVSYYNHIPLSGVSAVKIAVDSLILSYWSIGFGVGSGYLTKGGSLDLGYSFIRQNIGGSFRVKEIWSAATDLPDDYTGFFKYDNIFIFSGLLTTKALSETQEFWFGGGIGPSIVSFKKEFETPNPDFSPDSEIPMLGWIFNKEFFRDTETDNVAGLHLRGEIGALPSDHFGLELALWANLNTFKSLIGFDFTMVFGRVR